MATEAALAARYARAVNRLEDAGGVLQTQFGVQLEQQKVTQRDPQLGRIQQLENVAALLESVSAAQDVILTPLRAELAESNQRVEDATLNTIEARRERDEALGEASALLAERDASRAENERLQAEVTALAEQLKQAKAKPKPVPQGPK